ncbi:MAG: ferrous iron transport protein B [Atribacterota bacterium]|jgi:ferrous iron transport protein B|uniref:ferrous iron transport protein B n=1 Tax=Atribacter sp. TaxID=2847780 RepID=UPI00345F0A04|nr:ferrous iron transport protein B [Atribacterota bacterium]
MESMVAVKKETKKTKGNEITVALVGNPNSGKTTVFNNLTGAHQSVGNWPGVTVEKKEGKININGEVLRIIDLPGTYNLGNYSEDERIARDFILFEKPEIIINIVDATNLERNLYLTFQLLEMGARVVLALNMSDELKIKQMNIDSEKLALLIGKPVVPTVAIHGEGLNELLQEVLRESKKKDLRSFAVDYGKEIENEIINLDHHLLLNPSWENSDKSRWFAIKLLEGEMNTLQKLVKNLNIERFIPIRDTAVKRLENLLGEEVESLIAERRYDFIQKIVAQAITRKETSEAQLSLSDKIDRIVTNRYIGIPLFLFAMWALFQFTFKVGDPFIGYIEGFFEWLTGVIEPWLVGLGASELLRSFVLDGVIGGLGSVLVFIPNIFLLFLAISLLEDSGYMARAAYIMDRFMHTLGLHGKSFIPFLIGFGCNVPAIMATRTLENRRDRLITILINPLMSCSARLPVYILFAGAFFGAHQGLVIFSLYLMGIVLAILMGIVFKKFLFKGESSHFVMELPPYRLPTLKNTWIHIWGRLSSFIRRAGTIIFAVVILIWVLSNLPAGVEFASQESFLGRIGSALAPIFKPAGFGTWQAAVALLFGVLAKEVVVGTLAVLYGIAELGLSESLIVHSWTPLSAYAFMVMTLIYVPCVATIGTIKRETNSWGWTLFVVAYTLILGWLVAVLIFQIGKYYGLG